MTQTKIHSSDADHVHKDIVGMEFNVCLLPVNKDLHRASRYIFSAIVLLTICSMFKNILDIPTLVYNFIWYNIRELNASTLTALHFTAVDHVLMDWPAMELLAQTLMSVTWQIRVMNKLRVIIPFPDSGKPTYLNSFIQTLEGNHFHIYTFRPILGYKLQFFFHFCVIDVDLAQVGTLEVMDFLALDWTLLWGKF